MTYIALEDLNFIWNPMQVQIVKHMWSQGESLLEMAQHLERDSDEVALLVMDLARRKILKPRQGGLFGQGKHIESDTLSLFHCDCGVTFGHADEAKADPQRECPLCGGRSHVPITVDLHLRTRRKA